jgi:hypothetical protein
MKVPTTTERNVAFMHGMWLRSQECTGEGRMLADLTYQVEDITEKLIAVEDLNKSMMLDPWKNTEIVPGNGTRVLAQYVGVYNPVTGFISDGRFFPDGQSGSEPFTHWMLISDLSKNNCGKSG